MSSGPRRAATVVVPTHDHHDTLDLAVASALAQSVQNLEVVVVGDGVTPEVRHCARRLVASDPRVRFLDLPKGPHHGEAHRDMVVRSARTEVICYLCDDDLLLPEHVEDMIALLAGRDLAHSLNGHLEPDGTFTPYLSDLSSPVFRRWLMHPRRNAVSVTGTAHTRVAYLRLPVGWEVPPPGRWTDHLLWQKLLTAPEVRAATSDRVTALQFPSHLSGRGAWSPHERRTEMQRWRHLLEDEDARRQFYERTRADVLRQGAYWRAHADVLGDDQGRMQAHIDLTELAWERDRARSGRERIALIDALAAAQAGRVEAEQEARELQRRLDLVEGSRTWRLRGWLRRRAAEAHQAWETNRHSR